MEAPQYISDAATKGLAYLAQGFGGDGLTDKTKSEAREMANGTVSVSKIVRANAWAARHAIDLEAEKNNDSDALGWPGNGAVAHYLWGIDPLDPEPARNWFAKEAANIDERIYDIASIGENTAMTITATETIEAPRARALDAEARKINGREREVRVIGTGLQVEERSADALDSEPVRFSGYAAVFNSPSERLYDRSHGEFTELIEPGAFNRTLGLDNDVRMYVNHNSDQVLASTRSMTLNLSEDARGLRVEAELPNTTYAMDLAELMRSGVVDSMSFGFTVPEGGDRWQGDIRTLLEIALHEVSVVTGHPAYPETAGASVRGTESTPTPEATLEPVTESVIPLQINQRYAELYSRSRD